MAQSQSTLISEPPKIKPFTLSTFSPSVFHEVMGPNAMILVGFFFFKVEFQASFLILLFYLHQKLLSSSSVSGDYSGIICISEVVDISPGKLESSL